MFALIAEKNKIIQCPSAYGGFIGEMLLTPSRLTKWHGDMFSESGLIGKCEERRVRRRDKRQACRICSKFVVSVERYK